MTGVRLRYSLLALGVVAFTFYGSLVPFAFEKRSRADALAEFEAEIGRPLRMESKTDAVANILLGVPLGFFALGAVRSDKPGFRGSLLAGLALWPWCICLAVAVEFSQLYAPGRSCSANDILAQSFGSFAGLVSWLFLGQKFTDFVRRAWTNPRTGGTAGKVLLAYLGLVLLIELLPLDLSPSPKMVYDRFRDGRVEVVPFTNWTAGNVWSKLATGAELVLLFLPIGLLSTRLPGRLSSFPVALLAGLGFAFLTECGQLFVSREPSLTDVLWGTLGVVCGWSIRRGLKILRREPGIALEPALILGQLWFALMLLIAWQPLAFGHGLHSDAINWVPFADSTSKNYLAGLDEILLKTVLFLTFGGLVAACGSHRGTVLRAVGAAGLGIFAAGVLEFGQVFLPGRYPSMTDLLLAALGSGFGAAVARRLRAPEGPE